MRHDIRKDMNISIAANMYYKFSMIWTATRLITSLGEIFILSRIDLEMAQNDSLVISNLELTIKQFSGSNSKRFILIERNESIFG